MTGLFLGTASQQLYAYYHEPLRAERGQVLLCQPWGPEYEFAHRSVRFLARRLANDGWHVLRFDYRGTGDSWGDTKAGTLDGWMEDVIQVAEEFGVITAHNELSLVGLRLGATLAARAARHIRGLGKCVLWDPIVDGPRWMEELRTVVPSPPSASAPGPGVELGGRTVTRSLLSQLSGVLPETVQPPDARTLVLSTQSIESLPGDSFFDGPNVLFERLPQPSPWLETTALGTGQIPIEAVARIVEWMNA